MKYEFSLVLFTLLMQFGAGLALMIWLAGLDQHPALEKTLWRVVLACVAVGLGGATMHLANVLHAPYALTQIGTAWLSREIWAVSIFGIFLLLRVIGVLTNKFNPVIALLGCITVFVISQVYKVQIVPFWNTFGTELAFAGTALALGGGGTLFFLQQIKDATNAEKKRSIALFACVAGAIISVSAPVFGFQSLLSTLPEESIAHVTFAITKLGMIHFVAASLGCAIICYSIIKKNTVSAVLIGFLLLVAGEFFGRMLFYAANIKIGI